MLMEAARLGDLGTTRVLLELGASNQPRHNGMDAAGK